MFLCNVLLYSTEYRLRVGLAGTVGVELQEPTSYPSSRLPDAGSLCSLAYTGAALSSLDEHEAELPPEGHSSGGTYKEYYGKFCT